MTEAEAKVHRIAQCRNFIRGRKIVAESIGAQFVQLPVWVMLLELYLAHLEDRDVYLGSLCMVADTSLATAYRRTLDMEKHGLVERMVHGNDRRRILVRISENAVARMNGIIDGIVTLYRSPPP